MISFSNLLILIIFLYFGRLLLKEIKERRIDRFLNAVCEGNYTVVKSLLNKGIDVNIRKEYKQAWDNPYYGSPALITAAEKGYVKIVRLLLDKGADINAKNTYSNYTYDSAITKATKGGHISVVSMLLSKGANPTEGILTAGNLARIIHKI